MKLSRNILVVALLLAGATTVLYTVTLGKAPYITREKRWSVGIYAGPSPFQVGSSSAVANPVISAEDITDVPAEFVADPFMVRRDSIWYMFFEVLNAKRGLGEIGVATSVDALHWTYRGIVVREPFHLTYPYVFTFRNDYYMIPESGGIGTVRLYKSEDFPARWVFVANLLLGKYYVDSSIVQYGNRWWLFAGQSSNDTLSVYYADRLEGPWHEHPESPVVRDNPHISRPAGRVITFQNNLFRYAQDDFPEYGTRVWAFEITELTTTRYRERPLSKLPVINGEGKGWNSGGMHHIDPHQVADNQWIAAVDGFQKRWALRFYYWR